MADTSLVFNILAKDKASKAFDKLKGTALTAGVAIAAALTGGMTSGLEKGKTDALLAAQLGAGPQMAADFGHLSGQIYSDNFGENIGDVDNALKAVWQNGLIPEDAADADIQRVTEKLLTLSTTMQEDSDRVSSAVSQMLRTGMAKSAEEAFDILQRGVEQGVNKSQDLLDTFNEYPTEFRRLGLDGTAAMGLLSQAIKAGARDSDTAADALKEFAIRAVDGSKTTAAGFKSLGLDASKMAQQIAHGGVGASKGLDTVLDRLRGIKDPVKQSQIAVELFGTKAEDLGAALFAMDPSAAVDAMGKVGGAAQKAGDTLSQSAGAKLDGFKRKAEMTFQDMAVKALPTLEKLGTFVQDNSGKLFGLAVVLGGVAAAVWATNAAIAVYNTIATVVSAVTKVWAGVQWVMNLALWSSPITWIILAIVALIAIIVLIAMKTNWFSQLWHAIWGGIKAAAHAIGAWFSGPFAGFFAAAYNKIKGGVSAAKDWIVGKFNAIINFAKSLPGKIGSAISAVASAFSAPFKAAFNAIARGWNATVGQLSFTIPGWVPLVGGNSFSMPHIPQLATGGDVRQSGLAVIHRGERVVPAAQVSRTPPGSAAGVPVVVPDGPVMRALVAGIRQYVQTTGQGRGDVLGITTI